jgi:hypothetical protein
MPSLAPAGALSRRMDATKPNAGKAQAAGQEARIVITRPTKFRFPPRAEVAGRRMNGRFRETPLAVRATDMGRKPNDRLGWEADLLRRRWQVTLSDGRSV